VAGVAGVASGEVGAEAGGAAAVTGEAGERV